MVTEISVQVSPEAAEVLRQKDANTAGSKELLGLADEPGVSLQPAHERTGDPDLDRFFRVEVPDDATAQRVIARLLRSRHVEAAYMKPPDSLP